MACLRPSLQWAFVADGVMGGVSQGQIHPLLKEGRDAMRLTGTVSLENNGGFVQMAANLAMPGHVFDASSFSGLAFDACGNGQQYEVGLRTSDLERPWQSYRAPFVAEAAWQTICVSFSDFAPNLTETPMNTAHLRRIGILAVGRAMDADVSVANLRFITSC